MVKVERICCDHCGDEVTGQPVKLTVGSQSYDFCTTDCLIWAHWHVRPQKDMKPHGMPGSIKGFQPRVNFD